MVVINLTFFIELGLFLAFLWAVQVLVFRPLLRAMDEREETIDGDHAEAKAAHESAEAAEANYARELSAARRGAVHHVAEVRRASMNERAALIQEQRKAGDAVVAEAREKAQSQIEAQRPEFQNLSKTLAEHIVEEVSR